MAMNTADNRFFYSEKKTVKLKKIEFTFSKQREMFVINLSNQIDQKLHTCQLGNVIHEYN